MIVHKRVGKWGDTPETRAIWGDRAKFAIGKFRLACNRYAYSLKGEWNTQVRKKVTCKRCLKTLGENNG